MLCSTPIAERAGEGDLARERGVGDGGERAELEEVILAEPCRPRRREGSHALAHAQPCLELGAMALLVVEAYRLDASETLERPRQAHRRILPAGEQHERAVGLHRGHDDGSRRASGELRANGAQLETGAGERRSLLAARSLARLEGELARQRRQLAALAVAIVLKV